MNLVLSRKETRDIWRMAARKAEEEGRDEDARQMRATAKLWDQGLCRNWRGQIVGWR